MGFFGKERQDRTGQRLGQEERDIGDMMPRLDRLAGFRQTPVALDDMNPGKRTRS